MGISRNAVYSLRERIRAKSSRKSQQQEKSELAVLLKWAELPCPLTLTFSAGRTNLAITIEPMTTTRNGFSGHAFTL